MNFNIFLKRKTLIDKSYGDYLYNCFSVICKKLSKVYF